MLDHILMELEAGKAWSTANMDIMIFVHVHHSSTTETGGLLGPHQNEEMVYKRVRCTSNRAIVGKMGIRAANRQSLVPCGSSISMR